MKRSLLEEVDDLNHLCDSRMMIRDSELSLVDVKFSPNKKKKTKDSDHEETFSLPDEMIGIILSFLDWEVIMENMIRVSKQFYEESCRTTLHVTIEENWQYKFLEFGTKQKQEDNLHNDMEYSFESYKNPSMYNSTKINIQSLVITKQSTKDFKLLPWIRNATIFSNMKKLVLSSCNLDNSLCQLLCYNIPSEISLVELDLSINLISEGAMKYLFDFLITKGISIETLNLSQNLIRHFQPIKRNVMFNLKSLDLSYNRIDDCILDFAKFHQLEKLKLKNQAISGESLIMIQKIKTLSYLNLGWVKSFSEEICSQYFQGAIHPNLHTLKISSTIGDEGCLEIANCNLANLTNLSLDMSGISTVGCCYISNSKTLTKLEHLSLYGNSISDEGLISILESVNLRSTLKFLNLGSNNVSEQGIEYILENGINKIMELILVNSSCSRKSIQKVKSKFKEQITISKSSEPSSSEEENDDEEESEEEEIDDSEDLEW
ncbi:predicted protein [Naegleria gruberi]|uniref:Predicted protein n=1 Tax=Naegleria gruberi TaxID=5762 RepID=D2VHP0_NAEGR|nr:uncharacterized protein NAEGRDRAFT_49623 [Naegleria gruberi]EFC43710.1 predicted protein [Naegleria gruberi]|eukprot:XP_002676454.1 predicted protein [Naegleria gruberi strain NEG-M]